MRTVIRILLLLCGGHAMGQHRITGYLGIEQGLSNNSVTLNARNFYMGRTREY